MTSLSLSLSWPLSLRYSAELEQKERKKRFGKVKIPFAGEERKRRKVGKNKKKFPDRLEFSHHSLYEFLFDFGVELVK